MFLNIADVTDEIVRVDVDLSIEDLVPVRGERIPVRRAHLDAEVERLGRDVELRGRLQARLGLTCGRCLEPYDSPLDVDLLLTLAPEAIGPTGAPARAKDEAEDVTLFPVTDGRADLTAMVVEQLYLNLPLKPLCSAECRGLCPACGANRNRIECGCRPDEPDPRLAPLLEFRRRRDET